MSSFDDLLTGAPPRRRATGPTTCEVVSTDTSGCYVTPIGGDRSAPIGPCMGARGLRVGTVVLLIPTDEGYWIAASDGGA